MSSNIAKNIRVILVTVIGAVITSTVIHQVGRHYAPARVSRLDFEKEAGASGAFYGVFKQEFPEEYNKFIDDGVADINAGKSAEEARRLGYDRTSAIRKKYASEIGSAPDPELKLLIANYVRLEKKVLEEEGPTKCGEFAAVGATALLNNVSPYQALLDEIATGVFTAMALARHAPMKVQPATDEDWAEVVQKMRDEGAPDKYVDLLARQVYGDPQYCNALIALMESMSKLETESSHRVRATLITGLASS